MIKQFFMELLGLPFRFLWDKLNGEDKESRDAYDSFPEVFKLKFLGRGGSGLYYTDHPAARNGHNMASYITESLEEIKFRDDEVITIQKSSCILGLLNRNWNYVATSPSHGDSIRIKFHAKYPSTFLETWKEYAAGRYRPDEKL